MSSRPKRTVLVAALVALAALASAGVVFREPLSRLPGLGWLAGRPGAPAGGADPHAGHASPAAAATVWVCPMHPEVRRDAPGTCLKCGMDLVEESAPGVAPATPSGATPEAASAPAAGPADRAAPAATRDPEPRAGLTLDLRRQQLIGVRTAIVTRRALAHTTRAIGLVRYDETRQADVNLKVEAYVRDLYVDYTGRFVRRGEPLFTVYSPDLLATQNDYLLALRSRDQVSGSRVADAREYAARLAAAARQRLALWDLSDAEIDRLERTREPQATVVFPSPVSGYVIAKRVMKGQRVMPGESLYTIADLSTVWVEADVYERELALVRLGQRAAVTVDAYPGREFAGRVTYIYPYLDEPTRTVKVRLALPNPGGRLKPGMYANVDLSSPLGEGLVVPGNAVIDSGRAQYVFLALGDGYFEPRRVEVGARLDGEVQIRSGLTAGDVVASAATFFIDSESQMRAAMQGFEAAPSPAGGTGATPLTALAIDLRTEPDPPRNGDNTFIVSVRDDTGGAVDTADVSVRLYMPPMPSMNMPAMSADARLLPEGGGVYRGHANVAMAGRWEATVTVSQGGSRIGSRQFAIVAR